MTNNHYHVETVSVGQLSTNCYIVFDSETSDAIVIDPGEDGNYIAEKVLGLRLHLRAILLTHGHFDHMIGARELQEIFHAQVFMDNKDRFLADRMKETAEYFLKRKVIELPPIITSISFKNIAFGNLVIDVINSPGHTPGGLSFVIKKAGMVFTGDTLFAHGSVGRTDLSYSKPIDLAHSIEGILALPNNYAVYPGHGDVSSIAQEKDIHKTEGRL